MNVLETVLQEASYLELNNTSIELNEHTNISDLGLSNNELIEFISDLGNELNENISKFIVIIDDRLMYKGNEGLEREGVTLGDVANFIVDIRINTFKSK